MKNQEMPERPRHAVWLLSATIGGLACSVSPIFISTYSAFILPLSRAFGWSRGELSLAFSIGALATTIASPIAGQLVTLYGAGNVLRCSILAFAASVGLLAASPGNLFVFLALMALAGFTGAAVNTFVFLSPFPKWFPHRLGLFLGLAMTGIGVGQMVMPMLAQSLIGQWGWREAYLGLAAVALVGGCLSLFGIRDGAAKPSGSGDMANTPNKNTHYVLRQRRFWYLAYSFFAVGLVGGGVTIHLIPLLIDRGVSPMQAAAAASSSGLAILAGRLFGGALLDFPGARIVATAIFLIAATGALLLTASWSIAPVAVPLLIGLALGVDGDLMPFSVRSYFAPHHYSDVYSWMFTAFSFGVLIGPLCMGVSYDLAGDFNPALQFLGGAALLAIPLFFAGSKLPSNPVPSDTTDPDVHPNASRTSQLTI